MSKRWSKNSAPKSSTNPAEDGRPRLASESLDCRDPQDLLISRARSPQNWVVCAPWFRNSRSVAALPVAGALLLLALVGAAPASAAFPTVYGGDVACAHGNGGRRRPALRRPDHDLGRGHQDRRQRDPAPGPGLRARRPLSADRQLPRLGRLEDRASTRRPRNGPKRLRRLQHERPRLGQLLRRRGPRETEPDQMRRGLQPPDGRPLRGAGRPVPDLGARRRRRRAAAEDRRHRLSPTAAGCRWRSPPCATGRCCPTAPSSPGPARTGRRWRSRRRCRSGPGPTWPTR